MDYAQALAYMQGLRRFGIKLGNDRFRALLERLGDPHLRLRAVHVAGTKGKGSTTALVAAILRAHGWRVGGYYSPYVYDVRERVQVDGEMIAPEEFARLVTRIAPHIEALAATDQGSSTEFELKTAAGFLHFAEAGVDFAAVEVGLGGRLDATNVLQPLSTVITNIGLDHTHILGDTHAKIAWEKAGIVKPGVPLVTAAEEPSALEVIRAVAAERGAPLTRVLAPGGPPPLPGECTVEVCGDEHAFAVCTPRRSYRDLRLGMLGGWQRINAGCAIAAVEDLAASAGFPVREEAVRQALARTALPGRMEVACRRPLVILDGAHNAMAAEALAAEIARFPVRRLLLVLGMVAGHDPEGVVQALAPLASRVYATQPAWRRALPVERIAQCARRWCPEVRSMAPPLEAARQALADAHPEDLVLITGSFYVVGDVPPSALLPLPVA